DDNHASRRMLCELLEAYGMHVTAAASGQQALDLMARRAHAPLPFELAIIDLHMPEMNGLQLAAFIRAGQRTSRLPMMLLTSRIAPVDQNQMAQLGICHAMNKPVRREQLLATISTMLGIEALLPGADDAAPSVDMAPPRLAGTVLVVEDNATNQKVAAAMLGALGVHSVVAENGLVAVEKVRSQHFDLVLMDCQMPVMDGFAATAAIRALTAESARIPILALTANAMQGDEARCLAAGMDG